MPKDPNDLLLGGGVPTAKFPNVGDTHVGRVLDAEVTQQTDIDGNLLFWDDGKPREQIVATLQTEERDPSIEDDDGRRKLYIKGQMMKAVADAMRKAGAKQIVGGRLAVRFESQAAPDKPGRSGKKIYAAAFEAGAAPAVDDLLAGAGAQPVAAGNGSASADLLG